MMHDALLVDFVNGGCRSCFGTSALERSASDSHVFLLHATPCREDELVLEKLRLQCKSAQVLEAEGPLACALYRFKQALDELQLTAVKVLTSPRGEELLRTYAERLLTKAYALEFDVAAAGECACAECPSHAPTADSPANKVQEEVAEFVRHLPALRGEVSVRRSTLIPDCFGHGFSSRGGGASSLSSLSSLNLFCSNKRKDPRAVVEENKRRLALTAGFYPTTLTFPKVNHANQVWVMGKPEPDTYDGMVTDRGGVVLAAPGADCMTLLFADPVTGAIGATHAGWKGTVMGAAMSTVDTMVQEFGSDVRDILVAVGPSIGVCCYTMDREQAQKFTRIHPDCVPDPESARPHVNIRLANRVLLEKGGLLPEHIHDDTVKDRPEVTLCTCCNPQEYFSHVRDGPNFGTQVGFIWIKESKREPRTDSGKSSVR